MALPSTNFSLQDVIDEITKYGTVSIPPEYKSLVFCFSVASESGFALTGRDSLADFGGYEQPAPEAEFISVAPRSGTVLVSVSGNSNVIYDVDTSQYYQTSWAPSIVDSYGSGTSWLTVTGSAYNNGQYGDGYITISVNPAQVGDPLKRVDIKATKLGGTLNGSQVLEQPAYPATISFPSVVNLDINGTAQSILVESNTAWGFTSIASWVGVTPVNGSGNQNVSVSGQPMPVGTISGRSDVMTLVTASPGGNDVSTNVTVTQPANPAYIEIITPPQDPLTIGYASSPITFTVNTNAPFAVSAPNWITISNETSSSFMASFSQNGFDERSGDILVTTRTFLNDVSDDVTIIQQAQPIPQISLVVDSGYLDYEGSGYIYLSAINNSGNETYHIDTQAPLDFANPNTYNNTQSANYLPNGTYYVAVYDNIYGTYDLTTTSISAPAVPTTTTTQAPLISHVSERNDGGAYANIGVAQGYSQGSEVLVNDLTGICWTLGGLSPNTPDYYITGDCPPPTTTTLPPTTTTTTQAPVNCISYQVTNESSTSATIGFVECASGNYTTRLAGPNRTYTYCARENTIEVVSGNVGLITIDAMGSCS